MYSHGSLVQQGTVPKFSKIALLYGTFQKPSPQIPTKGQCCKHPKICCHYSDANSCLTVCNSVDYRTPGLPVPHHLPEFAHWTLSCPLNQPSHSTILSGYNGWRLKSQIDTVRQLRIWSVSFIGMF